MPVSTRVPLSNAASLYYLHTTGTTFANLRAGTAGTFTGYDWAAGNYTGYGAGLLGVNYAYSGTGWSQLGRTFYEFDLASYTSVTIDNAYLRVPLYAVQGLGLTDPDDYSGFLFNITESDDVSAGGVTSADWTSAGLKDVRWAENDKTWYPISNWSGSEQRRVAYFKLNAAGLSALQTAAAAGGKWRIQLRCAADIDNSTSGLPSSSVENYGFQATLPSGDAGSSHVAASDSAQLILGMDQAEQINLRNGLVNGWNFENTGSVSDDEGGDSLVSAGSNSLVTGPSNLGSAQQRGANSGLWSGYTLSQALPITLAGWARVVSGSPEVIDWADSDSASATKANLNFETGLTVRDNSAGRTRSLPITGSVTYGDPEDYPASFSSWLPWAIKIDSSGMVEYRVDDSPWMFDDRASDFSTTGLYATFANGVNRMAVGVTGTGETIEIDHVMMWSRALNDTEVNSLFDGNAWPFDVLAADMTLTAQSSEGGGLDASEITAAAQASEIDFIGATATLAAQTPTIDLLDSAAAILAGTSAGAADPDAGEMTLAGTAGDDGVFVPGLMTLDAQLLAIDGSLDPGTMTISAQPVPSDLDWCPDYDPSLPGGGYPDACDLNLEAQLIDMTVDAGAMTLEAQAIPGGDVNSADLTIAGVLQDGQELQPSLLAFTVPRIVDIDFYRVYITNEALTGNVGTATQFMLDERTTSPFTGTLTNENDLTVTKAELDAVQLVVYDKKQKVVLRETRDALEFIEADGDVDWLITPHETSLVNPDVPDSALLTHVAVWEFCWGSHLVDTASLGFATTADNRNVTVTHAFHGFQAEDHVIFKGAPEVGGLEMDGVFVVHEVLGSNSYVVEHVNKATSTASETRSTEFYWNPMTTKHAFEFIVRKREAQ